MYPTRVLPRLLLVGLFAFTASLPITGCGGADVTEGTMSPEMKSADDVGKKAMEEYAKSKKQPKKKAGGKAAGSGAAPIPGGGSAAPIP